MQLRHEYKHVITYADSLLLASRLGAVLQKDPHVGSDGAYHIRSLYFDTDTDKALREKLDGVSRREKYRIRIYNNDVSFIRLEKKIKIGGLGTKLSAPLTKEETERILSGDLSFLKDRPEPVLQTFYVACTYEGLKPRTVVDYDRLPFIYGPGNVRVTIDSNIRTGLYGKDLFDRDLPTLSAAREILLEVKYDNFLPEVVRSLIQLPGRNEGAFSKYAACRGYDFPGAL